MNARIIVPSALVALLCACLDLSGPPTPTERAAEPAFPEKQSKSGEAPEAPSTTDTGAKPETPSEAGAPSTEQSGIFAGAPAFQGTSPSRTANSRHFGSVAGRDCNSCHGIIAVPFDFAGTAYDASGAPAPGAEIRVVGTDGKEIGLVTTDVDGNFWSALKKPNLGTPKIAGKTAIRTAKGTRTMSAAIAAGGCNASQCHDGTRRIVVP